MSISIRKSIRWLPDDAGEPTSTIVVTSPGRRFVDIRLLLPLPSPPTSHGEDAPPLPLSRLDWAIAGTSSSRPLRSDDRGRTITRGQWRHWVDSRTDAPEGATDEGDNYPQEDGTTLEKGVMVNPDTGKETAYEEVWIDEEPTSTDGTGAVRSVVLQTTSGENASHSGSHSDGDVRGSVVRVGHVCQGFIRRGGQMRAERWEWSDGKGWVRTVIVSGGGDGNGDGDELALPAEEALRAKSGVGERFQVGGLSWETIESETNQA